MLVGDALIVSAFEGLAIAGAKVPHRIAPLIAIVGRAAGAPHGLVAGQAWESEPRVRLDAYHRAKTGLDVRGGRDRAGRSQPDVIRHRGGRTGECLGAAYQVADDLLDAHVASELAGKPTQQDERTPATQRRRRARHGGGRVALLRRLVGQAAAAVPDCKGRGGPARVGGRDGRAPRPAEHGGQTAA